MLSWSDVEKCCHGVSDVRFKFFLIEYKVCRILEYKVTNKLWGNQVCGRWLKKVSLALERKDLR